MRGVTQIIVGLCAVLLLPKLAVVAAEPQIGDCIALMFTKPNSQHDVSIQALYNQAVSNGWAVRMVDGTREPSFAKRWRIENYPTIVLVRNSREFDRMFTAPRFEELSKRMLAASNPESLRVGHLANSPSGTIFRGQSPAPTSSSSTSVQPAVFGNNLVASTSANALSSGVNPTNAIDTAKQSLPSNPAEATVRIRVDEPSYEVFGTGTIIDTHQGEALVLTCGHLFRDATPNARILIETFIGGVPKAYPAILIDFKADETDIGLVAFRPEGPVATAKLMDHRERLQEGEAVFSWGCDNGQNPSRRDSRITKLNRYLGEPNVEVYGAPVQGRSGGGLFNSKGELIGVCYAADSELNEGLYNAPQVVYNQLNRLGLQRLYSHHDEKYQMAAGNVPVSNGNAVAQASHAAPVQMAADQFRAPNPGNQGVGTIPHGSSAALFQPATNLASSGLPVGTAPGATSHNGGPAPIAGGASPQPLNNRGSQQPSTITYTDEYGRPQTVQVTPEMLQAIRSQGNGAIR